MTSREPFDLQRAVDFLAVSTTAVVLGLPTVCLVDYLFALIR